MTNESPYFVFHFLASSFQAFISLPCPHPFENVDKESQNIYMLGIDEDEMCESNNEST